MTITALLVLLGAVATVISWPDQVLFHTDFTDSEIGKLSGHSMWLVSDYTYGRSVAQFSGDGAYINSRAVKFQQTDFTITIGFRSTDNGRRQMLFADWSSPYQFMICITATGEIEVNLRGQTGQELLAAKGGSVLRGVWQTVEVSYAHRPGICTVYLNGVNVGSATANSRNHDLNDNNHEYYQVGYKEDTSSDFFKGEIGVLLITDTAIGGTADLYRSTFSGPEEENFDGLNGATFVHDADLNRNVLALDGSSGYALVPAVKFQRTDFTIVMVFKSTANGKRQTLFADWSKPWQFFIAVLSNGAVVVTLRRNINSGGSQPDQDLVSFSGGAVVRDAWQSILVTYAHEAGKCTLFLNGAKVSGITTRYANHDIQSNDHATYEVGYKKDTNSDFFKGRIGYLRIMNMAHA
ncbi:uncharacterized protein LOC135493470 [Lineus longissimus]|uniref:uncharacterized protein LOC135493470 n=1 Tax=Lineus longissimus TaxID=88925 RepID=UPI002B4DE9D6